MRYYSLKNYKHRVTFEEAITHGLAPDKGLYFPERIPRLSKDFIQKLSKKNIYDIAFQLIHPYIGDTIPENIVYSIVSETLRFPFPTKEIDKNIYALELYQGPTLAFKDIGAKFMAGCLGYFMGKKDSYITVLVATSGDTGGAVANGFFKVDGIKVVILYPSKRVSELQEKQLTTLGGNIISLEIDGDFDDCQRLVKKAFLDQCIQKNRKLTSANSINIARWLPQMFYYCIAYRSIEKKEHIHKNIVFSVPSGNFGNICAGMMVERMGLPISLLIASTNINDTIPRFMESGIYAPKKAKYTLSNAMDVSDPSNFIRILSLHSNIENLKKHLIAYKFTDEQTLVTMQDVWEKRNYMLDPHGAISYLGIMKYLKEKNKDNIGIFLETAHPIKFTDKLKESLRRNIQLPKNCNSFSYKEKNYYRLSTKYEEFREFLLDINVG